MKDKSRLLFLFLVLCTSNVYSLGWATLNPKPDDDKFYFHLDGDVNHTIVSDDKLIPNRHSYFWTHLTGGYEIAENFWISSWVSIYRTSISESFANVPFGFKIFPQLTYSNKHTDEKSLTSDGDLNKLDMNINVGTIGDLTYGKGLFFSQMTGLGTHVDLGFHNTSFELNLLGNGYWAQDDLLTVNFFPYKKYFGIGLIWEKMGSMGDRLMPVINLEIILFNQLKLYGEAGAAYVYNQTYDELNYYNLLNSFNSSFQETFGLNRNTIAGLLGIDWNFSFPGFLNLKGVLVNQVRYYGKEHSDFYFIQSQFFGYFNYYRDPSIDQKYNNQPFNFYFNRGEKAGLYLRQELDINPLYDFHLGLKNEFLLIYSTGEFSGAYQPRLVDTLTAKIFYMYKEHIDIGARVSNVAINSYELMNVGWANTSTNNTLSSEGIFLQPARIWYVELYSHFYF